MENHLTTTLAVIITVLYQKYSYKQPAGIAVTEIRQITSIEEFQFETYNSFLDKLNTTTNYTYETYYDFQNENKVIKNIKTFKNFDTINKENLFNLFLDKINEGTSLKKAIIEFNFLKKENYENIKQFDVAINNLVSQIKFLPPKNNFILNWKIEHQTNDFEKWKKFLSFVEKSINKEIQLSYPKF